MAGIGHNSGGLPEGRLKSFIERIERLAEEKAGLANDMKDVFAEAKSTGYDPKIMRKVIALRRMEKEDRKEQQDMLDLYCQELGIYE
jgi:uncharacterized protein (UPF0335 family)